MFGAFKKLFGKQDAASPEPVIQRESVSPAPQPPPPAPEPEPEQPAAEPPQGHRPIQVEQTYAPAPPPPEEPQAPDETIDLPLAAIVKRMPQAAAMLVIRPGNAMASISLNTITSQLRKGAVRIPISQLRYSSPPGLIAENPALDNTQVEIPLPDILARLDPKHLALRPGQREIFVPDDVPGLFDQKGNVKVLSSTQGAAPIGGSVVQPTPSAPPQPRAQVAQPQPTARVQAPIQTPVTQPAAFSRTQPPATQPPAPARVQTPIAPTPAAAFQRPAPAPSQPPLQRPSIPVAPAPATVSQMPSAFAPSAVKAGADTIALPLSSLMESWPEVIVQQIEGLQLADSSVSLPISKLEPAIKSGRVTFSWDEICRCLTPPPPLDSLTSRDTVVDLPLKVIIPLFLNRLSAPRQQREVTIDTDIPSLFSSSFSGKPAATEAHPQIETPAPTPAPAPIQTPTPAPAPRPAPAPVAPVAPKPAFSPAPPSAIPMVRAPGQPSGQPKPAPAAFDPLGMLFGVQSKTTWTPEEIVSHARSLPGIMGCLIADKNGFQIAGSLPDNFNSDAFAQSMPQILGSMTQYTKDLNLGNIASVTIEAPGTACVIYKCGSVFFAAVCRANTPPPAGFRVIASELAKNNP